MNDATTTLKAIRILSRIWGTGGLLNADDVAFLEQHEQPGETALDTCARLAGADIRGVRPFDHGGIRRAATVAEIKAAGR